MRFPKPEFFYKKILASNRCSQRARLDALAALEHPPLALLNRILRDPDTSARLLKECAHSFAVESLRREARKKKVASESCPSK
jgi:hypothetical protein